LHHFTLQPGTKAARSDTAKNPEVSEGQLQNRSRNAASSKEEPRRKESQKDTARGRDMPISEFYEEAVKRMGGRDDEGTRNEFDRPRADREEATAHVWKARSSTGPSAKDEQQPVHLRGRDSETSQMAGRIGTDRSHRHVVLKSRSRSPKGRPALARRREAHDEEVRERRPVVLESRRSDFREPSGTNGFGASSSSTRQVMTSQEDQRRWEGRDVVSPRRTEHSHTSDRSPGRSTWRQTTPRGRR